MALAEYPTSTIVLCLIRARHEPRGPPLREIGTTEICAAKNQLRRTPESLRADLAPAMQVYDALKRLAV